MSQFKLSKGTLVKFDLSGHGVDPTTITRQFDHSNSNSGLTTTRSEISEVDLFTGEMVKAAGATSVQNIDLSVRIPLGDTLYTELLTELLSEDNAQTLVVTIADMSFALDTTLLSVGLPVEESGFMHVTVSFATSGAPRPVV